MSLRVFHSRTRRQWLAILLIALAGATTYLVRGQNASPDIKPVDLSMDPLYAPVAGDKPAMLIALANTRTIAGAMYRDPSGPSSFTDDTYSNTTEYLGYFDAESCYTYLSAQSYFQRQGAATARTCADAFSGNYLNWVSMSAIDLFRLALTGGYRSVDVDGKTLLKRAEIPDGFFGSSAFPAKMLRSTSANQRRYFGAVPNSFIDYADHDPNGPNLNISAYNSGDHIAFYYRSYDEAPDVMAPDYTVAVEVCNKHADVLDDIRDFGGGRSLCERYPSGNYKPVGTIQKYSDQVRLALFSYLNDSDDTTRTGGVLRVPMKYVGYKTFDVSGNENTPIGGNSQTEWDQTTGVFTSNPDAVADFDYSGVVNYINRFSTSTIRDLDPYSELYRESIKYLKAESPSETAIRDLPFSSSSLNGYFPAYVNWVDPYGGRSAEANYACTKSSILFAGDASESNPITTGQNTDYASIVLQFENALGSSWYIDGTPAHTLRAVSNPDGVNNNNLPRSITMAGDAYEAHNFDIRPGTRTGLRVKTFVFDTNQDGNQNLVTTRRLSNPLFLAAKYGGFETDPSNPYGSPYNVWGNPFLQSGVGMPAVLTYCPEGSSQLCAVLADRGSTTDLKGQPVGDRIWADTTGPHAGDAKTYFHANGSARSFFNGFDSIFSRATLSARSVAGSAVASKNLTQAGNTIYQGSFDTSDWSGDVQAFPVTLVDGVTTIGTQPNWSASQQLDQKSPDTRKIFVGKTDQSAAVAATAFRWSELESSLQAALNVSPAHGVSDLMGEDRVNFLRGGQSSNYPTFRQRTKLLGDINNSGVVYSGQSDGSAAVMVGANDGMLHAFQASTGDELFAYIPSWVAPSLNRLTEPGYVTGHRSFVDGTAAVAKAQVGNNWKTVLVSGTGAGGRGVFALDVSNPDEFDASKVLWEFTNANDADLGNVVGRPQILKLRISGFDSGTPTYKWFAVLGSGVNNYKPDAAGRFSITGKPALFFLDLSKAAGASWDEGTNYFKISLPTKYSLNSTTAAGLINFTAVLDTAQAVSKIYMGDLQGNLWKLDFANHGPSDWSLNNLSSYSSAGDSPTALPMFIAKDDSGRVQPITAAPTVMGGYASNSRYVAFGTGKYLELADKTSTSQQSEYMVYDDGSSTIDASGLSAIGGRTRLRAASLDRDTRRITVTAFTPGRATDATESSVKSGWYLDLAGGERQISNFSVTGKKLIFGSLIPDINGATDGCVTPIGSGNQYTIDVQSGVGDFITSSVGLLGQPLVFEKPAQSQYGAVDSTGRAQKTVVSTVVAQGSGGLSAVTSTPTDPNCPINSPAGSVCSRVVAGRLSWRQIANYQELKNAIDW